MLGKEKSTFLEHPNFLLEDIQASKLATRKTAFSLCYHVCCILFQASS